MKLNELYNLKLLEYKVTGNVDNVSKLLAMLLLNEKDKFKPLVCTEGKFYETYKEEIDKNIEKVITDFEITKEKLTEYIENEFSIKVSDYEKDKIWHAFFNGIWTLHNAILYHNDKTGEELFFDAYEEDLTKYPKKSIFSDKQLAAKSVLHNAYNEKQMALFKNIECRFEHGPFLFLNDLSYGYASGAENKVIYKCACLACGRISDYDMHVKDRRETVYTNKESGFDALQDYYIIRKKIMESNLAGIETEDIVASINKSYSDGNEKQKVMKKTNH